jgi:hypothetical protein
VLLSSVYNKILLFHYDPTSSQVHLYELDPAFSYRNQHALQLAPRYLYQLQLSDNLLLSHNIDLCSTQAFDLKLPDYAQPLLAKPAIPSKRFLQRS